MAQSKSSKRHKAYKKADNIKKQKIKQMANETKEKVANMPISYTYHKDAQTVAIPMKAWQLLNQLAKELQPLAMLVSTFEQLGQEHIVNGTLIPVFQGDIEPEMKDGAPLQINGQIQYRVSDRFWDKHKLVGLPSSKPSSGLVDTKGDELTSENVTKLTTQP